VRGLAGAPGFLRNQRQGSCGISDRVHAGSTNGVPAGSTKSISEVVISEVVISEVVISEVVIWEVVISEVVGRGRSADGVAAVTLSRSGP